MEGKPEPEVFYGSAVAALVGLTFGLALHIPWDKHPGGPRILLSQAEAAEPARPVVADEPTDRPVAAPVELVDEDTSYLPPTPLPVTRLHPEMFDMRPAAADEAERQDVDDAVADDTPPAPPPASD